MRIHHLNCISTCPVGGFLMDGQTLDSIRGRLTCHCLLVEAGNELVLVDTGFGLEDVAAPKDRLSAFFLALLRPELRAEMTAYRQIEQLGFDPRDVRHVVLTHLDFDHAGGLDDFPEATVHLLADERDYAFQQKTWLDRQRFRPQQWSTWRNWRVYRAGVGERWYGLDAVRDLEGIPDDLLLVPLPGHTFGHTGIAVLRDEDWLLLGGDAWFYHAEMDLRRPRCTPGLRFYQTMMEKDRRARRSSQRRLRTLKRSYGGEITFCCSHDVREFERLAGRSSHVPAAHEPIGYGEAPQPEASLAPGAYT